MLKLSVLLAVTLLLLIVETAKADQDFGWMMQTATYDQGPSSDSLEDAVDYIKGLYYLTGEGLHSRFEAKGANCNSFIEPNGSYGPYGRIIVNAFKENPDLRNLLSDKAASGRGMPTLCPGFKSMTVEEREKFWVWTFAAIAWDESTCMPDVHPVKGYTTTAVGLLQMELPKNKRAWRGDLCEAASVKAPRENLLCGMQIMSGHFDGDYSGGKCEGEAARGLILNCSYWQKLHSASSPVAKLISLYPECSHSRVANR